MAARILADFRTSTGSATNASRGTPGTCLVTEPSPDTAKAPAIGAHSAPEEIRTPDPRFCSSSFAGLLARSPAVQGSCFELARVRIAVFGPRFGTC